METGFCSGGQCLLSPGVQIRGGKGKVSKIVGGQ